MTYFSLSKYIHFILKWFWSFCYIIKWFAIFSETTLAVLQFQFLIDQKSNKFLNLPYTIFLSDKFYPEENKSNLFSMLGTKEDSKIAKACLIRIFSSEPFCFENAFVNKNALPDLKCVLLKAPPSIAEWKNFSNPEIASV